MSRRVNFSPDHVYDQNNFYFKKKPSSSSNWNSRLQKTSSSDEFSVASFLKNIGTKVANALNFLSNSNRKRSSRKVSSASLARSRSYAETIHDSQRAEAIEDCIEFLNSSSCLHRSSSVSSSTCQ
ncbi:uncharacterized protein LOC107784457 [Nicotiana tabacum]|uniref:Josephin-like protein n=1 Tax=Nicotiana tabacum TaxID=4097 RepID=A0A1S3Z9I2_TOBAC|nr:josephin-like protein [Nicotiana tomentosiformis]XP_016461076.1 PREDICTED: josephin-like protein [Nicotiana tabacum]